MRITFDKSAIEMVLNIFDVKVGVDGHLIKNNEIVKDNHGNDLHVDNFAGVMKGENNETIFLNNNIVTLIELAEKISEIP